MSTEQRLEDDLPIDEPQPAQPESAADFDPEEFADQDDHLDYIRARIRREENQEQRQRLIQLLRHREAAHSRNTNASGPLDELEATFRMDSTFRRADRWWAQFTHPGIGQQVDAWGAIIRLELTESEEISSVADDMLQAVKLSPSLIHIPGLRITDSEEIIFSAPYGYAISLQGRQFATFTQSLPNLGISKVALQIVPYTANSLAVGWRLFEKNLLVERRQRLLLMIPTFLFIIVIRFGYTASALVVLFEVFSTGFQDVLAALNRFLTNPIGLITHGLLFLFGILILWQLGRFFRDRDKLQQTAPVYQQFESRLLATAVNDALLEVLDQFDIDNSQIRVVRSKQEEGLRNLTTPLQ